MVNFDHPLLIYFNFFKNKNKNKNKNIYLFIHITECMVLIRHQIFIIVKYNIFSPSLQKLAILKNYLNHKKKSKLLTMENFHFFFQIYFFKTKESIQLEVL
jgi:hypothetical protein